MQSITSLVELTPAQFLICTGVVFLAGVVRGFSGFALSALVMASLALIIPPIELIPVCWAMELSASLLMVRGGIRDADRGIVTGLVVGTICGAPIGYYLTTTLPIETSKAVALTLVLILASLQLLRVRAAFLATRPGLYLSGFSAGIATGLASIGGMVVALYVLAREHAARSMRGSLVLYLFLSAFFGFIYLMLFGMLDGKAALRGLFFALPCMVGVLSGQFLFRPSLERYYKPFCLALLMFLAAIGLLRLAAGG